MRNDVKIGIAVGLIVVIGGIMYLIFGVPTTEVKDTDTETKPPPGKLTVDTSTDPYGRPATDPGGLLEDAGWGGRSAPVGGQDVIFTGPGAADQQPAAAEKGKQAATDAGGPGESAAPPSGSGGVEAMLVGGAAKGQGKSDRSAAREPARLEGLLAGKPAVKGPQTSGLLGGASAPVSKPDRGLPGFRTFADQPAAANAEAVANGTYVVTSLDIEGAWGIARRVYGKSKYYYLIRDANPGVDWGNLQPRQRIRIPKLAASASTARPPGATNARKHGTISAPDAKGFRTYVVRKGDNGLYAIAGRREVYGNEKFGYVLERANPNVDSRKLQPGDQIVVPPLPAKAVAGAAAAGPARIEPARRRPSAGLPKPIVRDDGKVFD